MLNLDLPGITKECIEVCVEEGFLVLRAERRHTETGPALRYHVMERNNGKLERFIRVPSDADMRNVVAEFALGQLEVSIPKVTSAMGSVKVPIRFN